MMMMMHSLEKKQSNLQNFLMIESDAMPVHVIARYKKERMNYVE
jgi:hypothetical protein